MGAVPRTLSQQTGEWSRGLIKMCESAGPQPQGALSREPWPAARVEVGGRGRPGPAGGRGRRPSCCLCLLPRAPERLQAGADAASQGETRAERGLWPWGISGGDPSRPAGSEGLGPSRVILALGTAGPVAPGVTRLQAAALGYSRHPASWMGRSRGFLTSGPGTGPCTRLVAQLVKNPPA